LRILPTVSPTSGPRFVRHTGIAAPLSLGAVHATVLEAVEDLLLRRDAYRGATILLAAGPVGAEGFTDAEGSLPVVGIRVVIASGFAPAFFSEAVRHGLLLVALPQEVIDGLAAWVEANSRQAITVDLEAQVIEVPGMGRIPFEISPRVRSRLLHGLDDLDELVQHHEEAIAFRVEDRKRRPWLYPIGAPGEPSSGEPE
jgi:3-isopropylmalate/(R)-2-methylmalate dehydratase small subunit